MNIASGVSKKPKVSIILPTFNRAHLIGKAIDSILSQTYGDFELIVIDDGSTDNTKEVVSSISDSRVVFVQHSENRGGGAARNTGIGCARGEYIAFQDSDDEWYPDKLSRQVEAMDGAPPEVGVVFTGFWLVQDGRRTYVPYPRISRKSGNIHSELLKENFVTTPSMLARKQALSKSGLFDERLPRLQDWEFVLRLSEDHAFICIDEPLLTSYRRSDSISSDRRARNAAHEMILEKHFDDFESSGELQAHYLLLFELCFLEGEYIKAMKSLEMGCRVSSGNMRLLILSIMRAMPLGRRLYNEIARIIGC